MNRGAGLRKSSISDRGGGRHMMLTPISWSGILAEVRVARVHGSRTPNGVRKALVTHKPGLPELDEERKQGDDERPRLISSPRLERPRN